MWIAMRRVLLTCFGMVIIVVSVTGIAARTRDAGLNFPAAPQLSQVEKDLRALLNEQEEAWNRGDIDGFMKGYWKSPDTVFVGSGGVQHGWDAVLARYKKSYPDRAAMGHLTFSELEVTPLGPDAAVILGRWQLQREKDSLGGVFTLIARHFREGWRIIHDHTSAFAAPAQP